MVRQTNENHDLWSDCPPGTIAHLHDRIVSQRKRQVAIRIGGPMIVVMLLALGMGRFSQTSSQPCPEFNFGGVTCSDVQTHFQAFTMHELEPAQHEAMAIHLDQCPNCRDILKATKVPASNIVSRPVSTQFRGTRALSILIPWDQ
ncbi:hypothetical protein Pla52o_27610 [Novipirellula galeiformis]|uniref:Putative zinc-finger domain-containing protein n=1 Tax=Novipirellula galeiformis TaxID=2528004 RepID=A0A5C6CGL9_9BACT|nr:zf-HC2 domain-containing protein [Novipirellula galeiformis]TWU23225.1 hypothetical protein Pla52o_27610 [Novipirellula galeiformis]